MVSLLLADMIIDVNNYNTSDSGSTPATILQYVDVAGSSLLLPPANFNLGNTATLQRLPLHHRHRP